MKNPPGYEKVGVYSFQMPSETHSSTYRKWDGNDWFHSCMSVKSALESRNVFADRAIIPLSLRENRDVVLWVCDLEGKSELENSFTQMELF